MYFKLLFALLKMNKEDIQLLALDVLVLVTRNQVILIIGVIM